jgi:hypothetical protein
MAVIRTSSGLSVTGALGVFVLPCGRPGRRVAHGALGFLAAALALRAAFSASRRTPCATRIGHERRACTRTSDMVKNASPGTGWPYTLEKKRSRPWVILPALVPTTASPTSRETSPGQYTCCRKNTHKRIAQGSTVENKRCTVRSLPPWPAQRAMPSMVTRPVIPIMANAIRWNGRQVAADTWGCRHWKSAKMSIVGFCVG